jgi:hypothetical protein
MESASAREHPSRSRLALALAIAIVSDALAVWVELVPPVQIVLDLATAAALFAVLGFRWALLPPIVIEAIPGLRLFPTWILAVGALAAGARARRDTDSVPR